MMKINEDEFKKLCAEVVSELAADEDLSKGESKLIVMIIAAIVSGKIGSRLFSEDEEIEIVKEN